MAVKIGSARIDENGHAKGGATSYPADMTPVPEPEPEQEVEINGD